MTDWARAVALAFLRGVHNGTLTVTEGGRRHVYGDGDPRAHVVVHDPRAFAAFARRGSVGFGDSYVRGWWDCDDLTALVRILLRRLDGPLAIADRVGTLRATVIDPVRRLRRRPDPDGDRANIRAHYDLGNDFFSLMLDETMLYSCGIFERSNATLAEASRAKLDRICRKLALGPADHVVEIGTGWGGFALHAASRYGCRVTTTTISAAQYEHATRRVTDAGLAHLVTVRDDDYRDLAGTYDKLVSIEMIEAVDWREHDTFFAVCSRLLARNGLMALQAIVIDDRSFDRSKHGRDFIKEFVFPGGCLPSIPVIARTAARAGRLTIVDLEDIGRHYPETLRRWRANVEAHSAAVDELGLGPEFRRMWDLYLCYCEAAFLERHVSDVQVVLAKPGWRADGPVRAT